MPNPLEEIQKQFIKFFLTDTLYQVCIVGAYPGQDRPTFVQPTKKDREKGIIFRETYRTVYYGIVWKVLNAAITKL